jgi:alanine racemase
MSLTLYITTSRWRGHLEACHERQPGLVPVAKGNGYGFGNTRLAAEAKGLGVDTIAVGRPEEVAEVTPVFGGDILVLAPWRPSHPDPGDRDLGDRLLRTVADLDALAALADRADRPRVLIEIMTSMRRHGIQLEDLPAVARLLPRVQCEGVALHLPLHGNQREAAAALLATARAVVPTLDTAWVSHVGADDITWLAKESAMRIRPRVGTALWLGDRSALRSRATVLDVHRLQRGMTYGYRQRRAGSAGNLVIVSGGTSHGIGLEAPKAAFGLVNRGKVAAIGGLAATNRTLSPYYVGGRQRWFAEPPHMQESMIWLPARVPPPKAGDELDVDVRMTITTFDRIIDHP